MDIHLIFWLELLLKLTEMCIFIILVDLAFLVGIYFPFDWSLVFIYSFFSDLSLEFILFVG